MTYHVLVPLVIILLSIPATRNLWTTGLVAFSYATTLLVIQFVLTGTPVFLYIAGGSAVLFAAAFFAARRAGVFQLVGEVELKTWRMAARPFAFLFMPVGIISGLFLTAIKYFEEGPVDKVRAVPASRGKEYWVVDPANRPLKDTPWRLKPPRFRHPRLW